MNFPIGGYFELELQRGCGHFHKDLIKVNSGRHALEYILLFRGLRKIYLPAFNCGVLLEPIKRIGLEYAFYNVDRNLEIVNIPEIHSKKEAILYTNYFGYKDKYIKKLELLCSNIILDYSQSFFSTPSKVYDCFYSPRKFFGVPDGGYVSMARDNFYHNAIELQKSISHKRIDHLIKRIDQTPEEGYSDFQLANTSLSNEKLLGMSKLTDRLLCSIDYKAVRLSRRINYEMLHSQLEGINGCKLHENYTGDPFTYVFEVENGEDVRKDLISNKVYSAKYWPDILGEEYLNQYEKEFIQNLIHLPIDHRYGKDDMFYLVKLMQSILV